MEEGGPPHETGARSDSESLLGYAALVWGWDGVGRRAHSPGRKKSSSQQIQGKDLALAGTLATALGPLDPGLGKCPTEATVTCQLRGNTRRLFGKVWLAGDQLALAECVASS